ncbi:MAG: phage major capsid protein [Atopobiaceae bacterium]|nr:phage major capsid protein [Atopobiaceae bacterium]
MEFTAMSEREYRALGAEEYEQRRTLVLDLATEMPEDATDEQMRSVDAEVSMISAEDARRTQLAATRNAVREFVENGGGNPVETIGIPNTEENMQENRAATLGDNFVQFRSEHPSVDNRIIAPPFNMRAAGDPTTTGSFTLTPTQYEREVIGKYVAPPTVLDLFGRKTVSAPVYSWNAYSSTTGTAGITAEGATKNKLTYAYTPKTATLQKITGLIKVTEELFDDAPYVVDAINNDLVNDLNAARQAAAMTTLLGTSGVQTIGSSTAVTRTAEAIFAAILEAAADIEDDTGIAADAVVITPALWLVLRSAVDDNGHFYAGDPFDVSDYSRLFGMKFIKTADLTANHVLVGAFAQGADLVSKADGVRVDSTNSNDVDFEKNLISIRAEAREILAVKRPACFTNITVAA